MLGPRHPLTKMKQMGFRYVGEGAFEGQRFDGLEEFAEARRHGGAPAEGRERQGAEVKRN